jgi:hypothetical protein
MNKYQIIIITATARALAVAVHSVENGEYGYYNRPPVSKGQDSGDHGGLCVQSQ